LTLHFDKLSVPSLPKEEALLYPVRNNALLLPPGQAPPRKGSCPGGRPLSPSQAPPQRGFCPGGRLL